MLLFYLTIPLMLVGVAVALGPLLYALHHHERWAGEPTGVAAPRTPVVPAAPAGTVTEAPAADGRHAPAPAVRDDELVPA